MTGSSSLRPRDTAADDQVFHDQDLRVERSPEEFLAIAASLGRDYATPAPSSSSAGPLTAGHPLRPPDVSLRSRTGARHWPAGAMPPQSRPSRPQSDPPTRLEPDIAQMRTVTAALRSTSVTPAGAFVADGPLDMERSARDFAEPTPKVRSKRITVMDVSDEADTMLVPPESTSPVKRAYAKLRPKVRARDKLGSGASVADPGDVIVAPQGELTIQPHIDPSPPADNPGPEQLPPLDTAPDGAVGNIDQETTVSAGGDMETTTDGDATTEVTTLGEAATATPEAPLAVAALSSSSDEDADDYVLTTAHATSSAWRSTCED